MLVLAYHAFSLGGLINMRRLLLVALAATLAACGSDSVGPNGSFNAQFDLRTVNGSRLPYTFSPTFTITSDVLTLNSDGTYSDVAQLSSGDLSVEQGFYSTNNGAITFSSENGYSYQGSISGSTLTEFYGKDVEVFDRR